MSQHLVFANCIPLVIKFFNQTILTYVQAKNSISALDFPHCVVNEQVELTAETLVSKVRISSKPMFVGFVLHEAHVVKHVSGLKT